MPQREWNATVSVNGFNGMRKDDEWQGAGNAYDFGARIYDPRLGRFLSNDPLEMKYPYETPYCFVGNSPLLVIDGDGKEKIVVSGQPGNHKNKEHFLVNGLHRAKKLKKNAGDEQVT